MLGALSRVFIFMTEESWRQQLLGPDLGLGVDQCSQGPVRSHLDIEAAFLHVRRLVEVFKAVVLHCQLFPLLAAGLAGGGVL